MLEDFYERRAKDTVEAVIKRIRENETPSAGTNSNLSGSGAPVADE